MNLQPKSLVLVTVDCLRADHCGFNGYAYPTTPFLDSLAAESFVLPTAVIAGAPTYYSFPAILASRTPLALGRDVVGLAPGENTLATTLRGAGYATAAFSAANPYISPRFGYDHGFQVFHDFLNFGTPSSQVQKDVSAGKSSNSGSALNRFAKRAARAFGLSRIYDDLYFQYLIRLAAPPVNSVGALQKFPAARTMVDQAIAWLTSAAPRPFFLWLHLMDPHAPYYPSAEAFREFTGRELSASRTRYLNEFWNRSDLTAARLEREKKSVVELYDAAIRAMDTQVARLVAHLKQSARWEDCVFVLTADHGEEFLDHGRRFHAPMSLYDEIMRVPLLIHAAKSEKRNVSATPFNHLHLAPTLLEILGVPVPESFSGASLWRNLQEGTPWDVPSISECVYSCTNPFQAQSRMSPRLVSVRDARHKLVMQVAQGATEEIYDLQADPKEKQPLPPGARKEIRKRFLEAARRHIEKTSGHRDATLRLKARLRDLRVELQSNSHRSSVAGFLRNHD